jgi:hypothetical protein
VINNRVDQKAWFVSKQVAVGPNGVHISNQAALGVVATAALVLVAILVVFLVIKVPPRDPVVAEPPSTTRTTPPAAPRLDSCGTNLPASAEPPAGADDPGVVENYTYKVGSAAGQGRDIGPQGSITQAFIAGRRYISQVSAIVGVTEDRARAPHRLGFRIQRLDGREVLNVSADLTPENNNKDVVYTVAPPVEVTPREVLLLTVTNLSDERVRFFVDPAVSNLAPSPFTACIAGQIDAPARHPDPRGYVMSGSVTGRSGA